MGIFAINRLMNRQELAYSCAGLQDKLKDTVLIDWWVNTASVHNMKNLTSMVWNKS